ncbi:RNA-binding protein 33 isoform X2 [Ambystoma mexicanum]|uniref:RNA-binding protein 33 isoform X2 n=1 Tax=Ambystoma mexicanum TaxID=8296 RepID=UPI0037E8B277
MATAVGDDGFDQFDKPGSERSRRRRTSDDDWDSDLDDLLEEDLISGKKNQSDYSDEELNDDLLQSDEEEQEPQPIFSTNDQSAVLESDLDNGEDEVVYEEVEEPEAFAEGDIEGHYEGTGDAELTEELMEYAEEQEEEEIDADEVLDLEINEPLDEFQDDEISQVYTGQQEFIVEELEEVENSEETVPDSEELVMRSIKLQAETKDDSDEEEEDDEESGRLRFKTERKEGTIIRLSDAARERRNIPETLELSVEDKAALMEFEKRDKQRKNVRYGGGPKRGVGVRRGGFMQSHGIDQRRDNNESGRMRENRPPLLSTQPSHVQPIRSLFQQQPIQPLLPVPRPRHSSPAQQKKESSRVNTPPTTPQQSKNIHINPHFKGSVATPAQVPLLPTPNQPRPAVVPQRFTGAPEFQPLVPAHHTGNLNHGPRLPPPDHWRSPPPIQERDSFFIGDPRLPNHHVFDQRSPPPPHPPPLLNSNHAMPNQGGLSFSPAGTGFNPPGQQSGFNLQGQQPGFGQQGQPTVYNPPGQQTGFNQHGPPPRFNPQGQPPMFNQGHQQMFNQPGQQPVFNQQGQQLAFSPQGQQSGFNQVQPPGFNPQGQPCVFNQQGQQSGFNQHGPQPGYNPHGPQSGFNQAGQQSGYSHQGSQPGFPRDRSVRPNMQTPGPVGLLHYNQQAAGNGRPYIPPRQQFTPGPGQPFISHAQTNVQGPLHHALPPPPLHHLSGPPPPLLPVSLSPFRPHLQNSQPQQNSNRMQLQQRQGPGKPRHSTPAQNLRKGSNQQSMRNSNLRELPIAPSQVTDITCNRRGTVPAAQVKPLAHAASASAGRTAVVAKKLQGKVVKHVHPALQPKAEGNSDQKTTEEDEETRLYRLKIEEQKRLREEILKQKELRRQQQAGARKKELLERLAQQHSPCPQLLHQQEVQTAQMSNCNPAVPHSVAQARQNVKNRLLAQKPETLCTNLQQKNTHFQQAVATNLQLPGQQRKTVKQIRPNKSASQNSIQTVQKVVQEQPALTAADNPVQSPAKALLVQGNSQELKSGVKRTIMQRANSGSGDGPHVSAKVRVIQLSGAPRPETAGFTYLENKPQQLQPTQQSHQQRLQAVRKVTLTKGTVQQQQTQIQPTVQPGVRNIQGMQQSKKVMRGRGAASQMGRGRIMPNKQNLRVVECKPQPCTVSLEGLSSSTTDFQLQSLLMSVGPIESFQMLPEQRKAIAKFTQPQHASSFQQKFHRHMIDLSHINVMLLAE